MISYNHLVSIACSVAKRRYRALWEQYKDDCRQEAHLLTLSAINKHLTIREQMRRADRHFYRMAKDYGFARRYVAGNKKSKLERLEQDYERKDNAD